MATVITLRQPVAIDQYTVARAERRVARLDHRAGQVDTAHQRQHLADRRGAGNREAILVVDRGVGHIDQHILVREIGQADLLERRDDLAVLFFRYDCVECVCHEPGFSVVIVRVVEISRHSIAESPEDETHSQEPALTSNSRAVSRGGSPRSAR